MKEYNSQTTLRIKNRGTMFSVFYKKTEPIEPPVVGETVRVDGTEYIVKKMETFKCACGNHHGFGILV